jgi:hypothetical protein
MISLLKLHGRWMPSLTYMCVVLGAPGKENTSEDDCEKVN